MPRKDKCDGLLTLKLQPGATLDVSRYGVITGTAKYQCDYEQAATLWQAFGHVYQFTYDLTASGLKGWNPIIYDPYPL